MRNPDAVADVEDIARWRLLEQWVHRNLEATQPAIDWLVDAGWLIATSSPGVRPLFRLNAERRDEAGRFALDADDPPTS